MYKLSFGKDAKEDDLMNFSNMGLSLLNLSDVNRSRDQNATVIIETETPRLLDDNLLDMDKHYKDDKPKIQPMKLDSADFYKNKRKIEDKQLKSKQPRIFDSDLIGQSGVVSAPSKTHPSIP